VTLVEADGQFDGELRPAGGLDAEALGKVPAKRGVVLLTGQGGRPVALLAGANLRARLSGRGGQNRSEESKTRLPDLSEVTRGIFWKLSSSRFQTDLDYLRIAAGAFPRTYPKLLAWKPAWFIAIDPGAPLGFFQKIRGRFVEGQRYFGPFPGGKWADRFIAVVEDLFGLCRDRAGLAEAPHGRPCAYGEMGRCLRVCDGTVPIEVYRQALDRAIEFLAGRRRLAEELTASMESAARALRFEEAAAIKTRLDRLAELDGPAYEHVRPLEEFNYLIVQRGGRREVRFFLSAKGQLVEGGSMAYPLKAEQVSAALEAMARLSATGQPIDELGRWRLSLVAQYLFSGQDGKGLLVHWSPALRPADFAASIDQAAGELRVRPGRRR